MTTRVVSFPPYGQMPAPLERLIGGGVEKPSDWHAFDEWPGWHLKLVRLINIVLWPTYDHAAGKWTDGPAVALMQPLTEADFRLLLKLRRVLDESVGERALFIMEDLSSVVDSGKVVLERGLPRTLRQYLDSHAGTTAIESLAQGYLRGVVAKSGHFGLEVKRLLQRPRAYQMSKIMGVAGFSSEDANSAVTPAMISGHCMQTCMAGIAAFDEARKLSLNANAVRMLQQHTVDVGDRRVFAGVHYPSDNISSWIMSLLMQPKVCTDFEGHKWLWEGITKRSRVYAAIEAELARDKKSPYAASMRVLQKLGATPGMTVDEAIAFASPSS